MHAPPASVDPLRPERVHAAVRTRSQRRLRSVGKCRPSGRRQSVTAHGGRVQTATNRARSVAEERVAPSPSAAASPSSAHRRSSSRRAHASCIDARAPASSGAQLWPPQGSLRLRAPATTAARRPSARHAAVHATRSGPMGTTGARRITGPAREFAGARLGRPRGSPALRRAFRPCAPPRWPRARARQSPARASCTSGPCRSRSSGSPPRSGHGWGP